MYCILGLHAPEGDLTLLWKNSTQMCFLWEYSGTGTWNYISVELFLSEKIAGLERIQRTPAS